MPTRNDNSENKADVARREAARSRMRHSRARILAAADHLADDGQLVSTTMKDLAAKAGVSVNTIKRQFPTVGDVVAALVVERDRSGQLVPQRMRAESDRHSLGSDREYVTERLRSLRALKDVNLDDAVEQTRDMYFDVVTTNPEEHHLLAAVCCYLSYRLLLLPVEIETVSEARERAERGLRHIVQDKGRHYALGGQLARNAAAAAQRACLLACSALGPDPDEIAVLKAKLVVIANLSAVADKKQLEKSYESKLNQPLIAAAAEFHRARAVALINEDVPAEIDAVIAMARTFKDLAGSGESIPPRILVPFLTRMCAVQVAYEETIATGGDAEELQRLRDHLLATLSSQHRAEADIPGRALATMFALADREPGDVDGAVNIHLADLILLCGYGVIGQLLVADFLYDIAQDMLNSGKKRDAEATVYAGAPFLDIKPRELFAAAKMYYTEAPKNTLVVGSAAVLASRARQALKDLVDSEGVTGVDDAKPWPVLQDGDLNTVVVNQLSLAICTGQRPTQSEAAAILRELQPLLLTLRTIAGEEVKPDENGASEAIPTTGLRFY